MDEDDAEMIADDDTEAGTETPMTGTSSVISGLETPDTIDLRKGTLSSSGISSLGTDTPNTPQLYTVIKEQAVRWLIGCLLDWLVDWLIDWLGIRATLDLFTLGPHNIDVAFSEPQFTPMVCSGLRGQRHVRLQQKIRGAVVKTGRDRHTRDHRCGMTDFILLS